MYSSYLKNQTAPKMGYREMKGRTYACAHRGRGLCRLKLLIRVDDTNLSDLYLHAVSIFDERLG
jgi:hypothetical protein